VTGLQYRACGQDHGDRPDYGMWWETREEAEADAAVLNQADPPYEEVWVECRTVSEPERVAR
jgi:hypothetical protein